VEKTPSVYCKSFNPALGTQLVCDYYLMPPSPENKRKSVSFLNSSIHHYFQKRKGQAGE
jgi:hypothetical protein